MGFEGGTRALFLGTIPEFTGTICGKKKRNVNQRSRKRCRNSKLYFQIKVHNIVTPSTCLVRSVGLGFEINIEKPDIEILLTRSVLRWRLRQSQWRQSSQTLITTDKISWHGDHSMRQNVRAEFSVKCDIVEYTFSSRPTIYRSP
jgi:hypothetical protein